MVAIVTRAVFLLLVCASCGRTPTAPPVFCTKVLVVGVATGSDGRARVDTVEVTVCAPKSLRGMPR